jgi:hypothetical protein
MAHMLQYFRVKKQPEKAAPGVGSLSGELLAQSPDMPVTIGQMNALPEHIKARLYRGLLPPALLARFGINPLTWKGADGAPRVVLKAAADTSVVSISVRTTPRVEDEFFYLELSDSALNSPHLDFLLLGDPRSPRFCVDCMEDGRSTLLGSACRNLAVEEQAMQAGLAPAQVRQSLGASRLVLQQLEVFLAVCGQVAYGLEPLTYVSAWVFERYGFAYSRGHKLMDDIQCEFQPGGRLHRALDGSTPFRQPDQWRTVRGRAWAIHDGILEAIGARWDELRMVKRVGRHAGVETFPGATY